MAGALGRAAKTSDYHVCIPNSGTVIVLTNSERGSASPISARQEMILQQVAAGK